MKRMRKWKQAITALLSVAMLVTAVPQTATVALAVEGDAAMESMDVSVEKGDTELNTNPGAQGESEESDEENGKESGSQEARDTTSDNGDDAQQPDDSDGAEGEGVDSSDADDAGAEDDEEALDENGEDVPEEEFAEDEQAKDESVSMNKLEVASVDEMANEDVPEYKGEVEEYTWSDGTKVYFLNLDMLQIKNNINNTDSCIDSVIDILQYHKSIGKTFRSIYVGGIHFSDEFMKEDGTVIVSKDIVNTIVDLWGNQCVGFELRGKNAVTGLNVNYDFFYLQAIDENVEINTEMSLVPYQGMKVRLTVNTTDFPGKSAQFRWDGNEEGYVDAFGSESECDVVMLEMTDGKPDKIISDSAFSYYEEDSPTFVDVGVNIDDLSVLQSGAEYLLTPIYDDVKVYKEEYVTVGSTRQLEVVRCNSESVTNASWTSLNPEVATIDENGLLTAVKAGKAYYYVTYTSENNQDNKYLEFHVVRTSTSGTTGDGTVLDYVGEVTEENGELSLAIDTYIEAENRWMSNNEIETILKYYKEQGKTFDHISIINMYDGGNGKYVWIPKQVVNTAREVLTANGSLTYGFELTADNQNGYFEEYGVLSIELHSPKQFSSDLKFHYSESIVENQGVKIKFADSNISIPAEFATVDIEWNPEHSEQLKDQIADWDASEYERDTGGIFGMYKLSSNQPSEWMRYDVDKVLERNADGSIHLFLGEINNIPLGAEYMFMPTYELKVEGQCVGISMGKQVQATAGRRCNQEIASATWKSLSPDVLTVDQNGLVTAGDTEDWGRFYAKYTVDGKTYLEMYSVSVVKPPLQIVFDDVSVELDLGKKDEEYLRLRFYPSDTECAQDDPKITWTIQDSSVVTFIRYNKQGEAVVADKPDGTIKALKAGETDITAVYANENGETATATCHVTVTKPLIYEDVKDQIEDMDLYALTNLDTTLDDVRLPYGWEWKYPDTSLANFKDMDGHSFPAIYTDLESGKTFTWNLWVRMVTVTGISIVTTNELSQEGETEWLDSVPDSIAVDESIILGCRYKIKNLNEENPAEYTRIHKKMHLEYSVEWSSKPTNTETISDNDIYSYKAEVKGSKAESKTFTVEVKDPKTKKVLFKASRNIVVTLNPKYDFERIDDVDVFTDPDGQKWLQIQLDMSKEDYLQQPLTVASEDSAILKLDTKKKMVCGWDNDEETQEGPKTLVLIPCTNPKPGTAWIKVTAPDEMKSVKRYSIEFVDKEPKLMGTSTVNINKAAEDRTATVTVRTRNDWPVDVDQEVTLSLNKKSTESLTASVVEQSVDEQASYRDYTITLQMEDMALSDRNVKKGKNTVAMTLTVKPGEQDSEEQPEQYTLNLTLNVTDSVPKVTFKQTGKVNLFYNNEEGYGVLNVSASGAKLQSLALENYEDAKNPKKNADCDYELKNVDDVYYIVLKENGNVKNTKGLLTYKLDGYEGLFRTAFTVKTENKKPTIVLSAKSEVLYPDAGYTDSWLTMLDKVTGECVELAAESDAVHYVVNQKKKLYTELPIAEFPEDPEIHDEEVSIKGNNTFNLLITPDGNIVSRLQEAENGYSKKADKFSLEIKKAGWNDWVPVSYSLTVNTAKPKLVLSASTLKLNKNNEVYKAQMARTSLRLKGYESYVMADEYNWVSITPADAKSKKVVNRDNSLVVQYWGDCGDVIVKFNNNKIEKGKYKFNISVGNDDAGTIASTTLTVEVIDTAMDKNLKVSAKGSIDVLDREGTSIAYTPKLSNLSGEIVDGWLEGKDSALFRAEFDDGRLIVRADGNGTSLSTKNTYQVEAVFLVDTEGYDSYTIRTAKPLSIKLKQGKPKLTASTNGNTLYRQLDNTVQIKLSAVLNKKEVEIEDVWLLNYTEDLQLVSKQLTDEEGHAYEGIYDPRTKSVTLALSDRYYADSILQSGKTWKVKLAVRYRDKAGNEKNAEVTCPIVVK